MPTPTLVLIDGEEVRECLSTAEGQHVANDEEYRKLEGYLKQASIPNRDHESWFAVWRAASRLWA
jgi:hypothetical protein